MNALIIKLGATGDVVRTTPLLRCLPNDVTWITADKNKVLFEQLESSIRCVSWDQRKEILDARYDLVVNLEDTANVASFVQSASFERLCGAHLDAQGRLTYTDDLKEWFDLSIISVHGKRRADDLKLRNRRSYQDLIFEGLGFTFHGESYVLPKRSRTDLVGDVAIAADSGPVWPMKKWAHYSRLKTRLEAQGLVVNYLPTRSSLLEHLADVQNHRCLVGGDSLPMHFALGSGVRCVTLFNCTSPWEIYDYGLQTKIVSPLLKEFFYKRGYDERATTAITVDEVFKSVMTQVDAATLAAPVAK